jgi:hypothetical protein
MRQHTQHLERSIRTVQASEQQALGQLEAARGELAQVDEEMRQTQRRATAAEGRLAQLLHEQASGGGGVERKMAEELEIRAQEVEEYQQAAQGMRQALARERAQAIEVRLSFKNPHPLAVQCLPNDALPFLELLRCYARAEDENEIENEMRRRMRDSARERAGGRRGRDCRPAWR